MRTHALASLAAGSVLAVGSAVASPPPAASPSPAAAPAPAVSPAANPAAVRWLFNGRDLNDWRHVGAGRFELDDGFLKTSGSGMGMLWYTREPFGDCSLRVVFRLSGKGADSGLFVRMPLPGDDPWQSIDRGYEIEIGDWPEPYGRTGAVYSFSRAQALALRGPGIWNTLDVDLDGPRIVVYLNGKLVSQFQDGQPVPKRSREHRDPAAGPRPLRGYVGLQNENGGSVEFREVSVRPLSRRSPPH